VLQTLVSILVFAPLCGAIVAGLFGKRIGNRPSMAITTGLLFLACGLAWRIFIGHTWGHEENFIVDVMPFIHVGDFQATWSIRVDSLSAVMLIVVTTVSALVHLYSWGYMDEDPGKPRFFAYLSLFTFAMLALVTAEDFMQLFFGWEGVGLASYLLIGFWFHKESANAAAIKAFVVNRVGDFGFVLGIMTVFWMFHTIRFDVLFPLIASKAGTQWMFLGHSWSALDLAGCLLFIGAMGKSAQFFLHTWLPDAMEGPTPVSALIHAATMVTAGVYMVCLLSPIFEHAPFARDVVLAIGAVTSLFAATVGMMQNDIKRVIAYSTCSQLGYMFIAAGAGAYQGAMFHLFTHAYFKALLFLGAGSVIHAMHHEQDMRAMGGLRKLVPITFGVMVIGTIAITGLGIPGTPLGFAGFFSKDAILEAAWRTGQTDHVALFGYFVGVFVAGLTSYYSWRLVFMTFEGKPKWVHGAHVTDDHASQAQIETHSEPDTHGVHDHGHGHEHGHDHKPHESPWVMLIPLLVLSVGAIFAGGVFDKLFIGEGRDEFWRGAIFVGPGNQSLSEGVHLPVLASLAPLTLSLIGLVIAAFYYIWNEGLAARMAARKGPLWTFLYNKWFFDELYDLIFVRGAKALGDLFWKVGDRKIIDGLGPNGAAWASLASAKRLVRIQTGYVYHYAFVMLFGVAGLLTWVVLQFH
jgi:NADH-quinone oxidoreductase subunit L